MLKITEFLTLDAALGGVQATLYMKRADTGSRVICVNICSRGEFFSLDQGEYALLSAKKPDGSSVIADCTVENGIIYCPVPAQLVAADGTVACELTVYGTNGSMLTSPRFEIIVENTLYEGDAVKSTDEYSALISALAEARKLTNVSVEAETLPIGSEASVTVEVSETGVDFKFGLPKGEKGDTGAAGEGAGDMHTSVYDTNNRSTDIFKYIDTHKSDNSNPHGVTAAQVGADPSGSAAAVNAKTDGHIADKNNPHGVTAKDVGAYPLYTSLEDIGCTADNTIEEVYKAMPEYSLLILRWVGKSAGSFANTTFGNSFPTNYGTLYAQKTNPNSSVNEWTYYPYVANTASYEKIKPYKKMFQQINGWIETDWTRDVSEEMTSGTISFSACNVGTNSDGNIMEVYTQELRKIGSVVYVNIRFKTANVYGSGSLAGTLPSGFRPSSICTLAGCGADNLVTMVSVGTSGVMKYYGDTINTGGGAVLTFTGSFIAAN